MTQLPLFSLFKIILDKKSTLRFLIATVVSLSFSVAVILATIGLMDGYGVTLKNALALSNGDIKVRSRDGFYASEFLSQELQENPSVVAFSPQLEVEAFALPRGESKGVMVKGVHPERFEKVTGIKLTSLAQGVAIGSEFAKKYQLALGDSIVLALRSNKKRDLGGAILQKFAIEAIVTHGIYEKDLRFVYVQKKLLEDILGYRPFSSNIGLLKLKEIRLLENSLNQLNQTYGKDFLFEAYWAEHEVLLDAVEIERDTIGVALQLIVLVSVINIIAFMMFLSEIKSQDIFMLRALGLSQKAFQKFWFLMLTLIWVVSSLMGYILVLFIDRVLLKISFLQLPGDIYKLSELNVLLNLGDYLLVYGLSLAWIFSVGSLTMRKIQSKSLLSGLRQEFN